MSYRFWFEDDFKLIEIIPLRPSIPPDRHKANILRLLFQEKHLVQCLERRTSWHFNDMPTLRMIIDCVPSFSLNAMSVTLCCSLLGASHWRDVDDAVLELKPLKLLTRLTINQTCCDLDLGAIGLSCLSLRYLQPIHIGLFAGTLNTLSSLNTLHAHSCIAVPLFRGTSLSLVPASSTASLTHLAFVFGNSCLDGSNTELWLPQGSYGGLGAFINLKSLYIHPMTNELCDFLARASTKLNELRTTVIKKHGTATLAKIIDLFTNSVGLKNLSSLCLAVEENNDWRSSYQRLAKCITMKLCGIEEIVFGMGMDVLWLPMFGNLTYLKRMMWYVPGDDSFRIYCKDAK